MNYNNIKSPKKPGLRPSSEKLIFRETTREGCQVDHSTLFRVNNITYFLQK